MNTDQTPIQPVPRPILCNPYEEPRDRWIYGREAGVASQAGKRRRIAVKVIDPRGKEVMKVVEL